ncbi:unnamed protein product [Strongylus vulgaris]|uniref:Uncharacterized protein n=1 Tax=Strongylus vulgaris TaxID=40348 RepID=A0A3P7LA67_STRVU|nr:unnamed protein product [Strongylus vulgaris]
MKDCVRIIYYCHVKRSSGCRYEMSVCIPNNPDEKLRIDDFNVHTCNPDSGRVRRKAKPQIEDFSKPLGKRKSTGGSAAAKGESPLPFPLSDPMTSFFAGVGDHFETENVSESAEQRDFGCSSYGGGSSENLTRFISELGDAEQGASTSKSSAASVWSVVDIDVVDFTKRPDPPFTYTSQYSYAFPMIGNQPEVVADALLNLFYLFGPSNSVKLEPSYRGYKQVEHLGTALESMISERFPCTRVVYYAENRNKQGALVPRREESMIRERIYAWLMDNGKVNWFNHLNEIKHMHNSEWIDELGMLFL